MNTEMKIRYPDDSARRALHSNIENFLITQIKGIPGTRISDISKAPDLQPISMQKSVHGLVILNIDFKGRKVLNSKIH